MKKLFFCLFSLTLAALLNADAPKEEQTVFIKNDGRLAADSRLPMQRVWKDPSVMMSRYHKIIIKDVRTDLQLDKSWMERNGISTLEGDENAELQKLADYMKKSFSDAIQNQNCRMKLTSTPAPDAISLEIAIVKVVTNKPLLETGATVGAAVAKPLTLCLIPVKSVVSKKAKSPLTAFIAVEGKVLDSVTGKEVALFTMKSYEKSALLDVNHFVSPYANVMEIIDRWSSVLVEIINKRPLETGEKINTGADEQDYSLIKL